MMTVVDQVRPWLMPSSTFATMTQPQVGAQISSSGTGTATSQPATRTGLRPYRSDQRPGEVVGRRLGHAEREDERQRGGVGGEVEHLLGQQRQDGAFLAEHAADQGVDRRRAGRTGPGWRARPGWETVRR